MCRSALNAVAVVNTALARFGVNIEMLEIIIEVDRTGAKIATEKGCMSCEDCGYVYPALFR